MHDLNIHRANIEKNNAEKIIKIFNPLFFIGWFLK